MGETVIEVLRAMRPPLHCTKPTCMRWWARSTEHGLPLPTRRGLGAGCRIDYLVGDVGVEIKKGKPNAASLVASLSAMPFYENIASLVVSRAKCSPATRHRGKSFLFLPALQLWGVSLP